MKKSIILITLALAIVIVLAFSACAKKDADTPESTETPYEVKLETGEEKSSDKPPDSYIIVNKEKREVSLYAKVNGKYVDKKKEEDTRHAIAFKGGSNGDSAILISLGSEKTLHKELLNLGFKPGDNLRIEDMSSGKKVEGDKLDVFVSWGGNEIPFADIILIGGQKPPLDIRFGGNLEAATAMNTGSILCLDSCATGITSNAAYGTGSVETKFYANIDALPKDGTVVKVTFRAHR